jgi:hypothetical protein
MNVLLLVAMLLGVLQQPTSEIDLYVTDYMAPAGAEPEPLGGRRSRRATLFATPGEYEPVAIALANRAPLRDVAISSSSLIGPMGVIPAVDVRVRSVERVPGLGRSVLADVGPGLELPAGSTRLFWVTVRVPPDAEPGLYAGTVSIASAGETLARLDLVLDVLPLRLEEPPFALGFNYSDPHDPQALAGHLADMREHGMTVVAPLYEFHLPVDDDDTTELSAFIETYQASGFTQPMYFATPMVLTLERLRGYGPIDSKRFQQKYIEVMRRLHRETRERGQLTLFSIGDEYTNRGLEGVREGGQLARFVFEELPELATTSDMNGYREVMEMAPYLSVAAFNNGWDGIDNHNRGRKLANATFISELRSETGAIPWFVNTGSGRFPFGLFFWRMTKLGGRGKVEWYYNLGPNRRGSLVHIEDGSLRPTLDYERSREGIDDLKYLLALEQRIKEAKARRTETREVDAAVNLLERLEASVIPDWSVYAERDASFPADGFEVVDPDRTSLRSLNEIRRTVADHIMALDRVLGGGRTAGA